jgi:hypothetical protein
LGFGWLPVDVLSAGERDVWRLNSDSCNADPNNGAPASGLYVLVSGSMAVLVEASAGAANQDLDEAVFGTEMTGSSSGRAALAGAAAPFAAERAGGKGLMPGGGNDTSGKFPCGTHRAGRAEGE